MNQPKSTLFTKINVAKHFQTETGDLPANQAGLIRDLSENFGDNAKTIVENVAAPYAEQLVYEMIGTYAKGVAFILNGSGGGNA